MAGTTVEDFYIRLGLSLSELESGFVEANRTIAENIGRLNREANLIRLRSEVEISGLDEVADAERILQIRLEALNQQMTLQRDRVRLVSAELQNLTAEYGENAAVTQRAATRLERERLALANLERGVRELSQAQNDTNESVGELNDMLPTLSPRLQAVAGIFSAISAAVGAAGMSVSELLENFRELKTQSYELNMSFDKTRDFLRELNLGGGDIGDIEGYIRGITDAFVKGEADDPEFIALRKYGAEITDATGRLKDFKDILDEVYQAWKRADEAGEGIEFLQLTGGESGIRDAIQYFKRRDEALKDSAKIVKSEFSSAQIHELDRAMKLVEEQSKELKGALGDIFTPAAQSAAEKFFGTLQAGTEALVENKDAIQSLGFIAAETVDTIKDAFSTANGKIADLNKSYRADDASLKNLPWRYGGGTSNPYGVDKMIEGMMNDASKPHSLVSGIIERARQAQKEYNDELAKTKEKLTELYQESNPLNQYAAQRIQKFKDELEDLRIDLDMEDEFERAKAHLQLELDRELERKNYLSDEEREAITALGKAKFEQIEKAQQAVLENAQKDFNSQMQSLYKTALENRLDQIEKERQAWIDKCGDEVKATQKAEQEKFDAQRNAAMNVIKQQAKEYEAFQKGGLAGLQAYKMADLARQGVNLSYFSMTPQQLQQFQQAYQLAEKGLMPQFMTETDKAMYREQMQQSYQPIKDKFDAENYAIVNGIKTTMSEALGGVPITLSLDKDINLTLSPNGQRATMRDYETDNNGRIQSMTETKFELPSIVSEVAQSFSEMPSIVQVASDSLNELPVVIQGITENLSSIEMPQFEDMNQPLKEVTVRLNDLSSILESFSLPDKNQSAEKRTPVNVNVAVQIQEAHAWDSEHIQELSDRVADKIQPEIISAIGGDSNSY